jgi:ArsR family transcriptional regulator
MPSLEPAALRDAERLFRALSDPLRLRIVLLLRGREVCVGDLAVALDVAQPTASRHLAALKRAGLVGCREDGTWRHYRLAPARGALERRVLAGLSAALAADPEAARDLERLERLGGCC